MKTIIILLMVAFLVPAFAISQELHLFDNGYTLNGSKFYWIEYKTKVTEVYLGDRAIFAFRQPADAEMLASRNGFSLLEPSEGLDAGFRYDELRGDGISLHIVLKSDKNVVRWISYIKIESERFRLGNGMRVGMSASALEQLIGARFEGDSISLHVTGMDFPARYKYEVDGSPIDPLIAFIRIKKQGDKIKSIVFYVEETVNT